MSSIWDGDGGRSLDRERERSRERREKHERDNAREKEKRDRASRGWSGGGASHDKDYYRDANKEDRPGGLSNLFGLHKKKLKERSKRLNKKLAEQEKQLAEMKKREEELKRMINPTMIPGADDVSGANDALQFRESMFRRERRRRGHGSTYLTGFDDRTSLGGGGHGKRRLGE